ncbi:MAG: hypothetical protein RLZZ385_2705 [Pseudomonadota bacterium]|jgi:thiamine biosynthesis protein ThiS
MRIKVNGETATVGPSQSLANLLGQLGLADAKIAVELNRQIVPRSEYASRQLQEGDELEIVQAIGGG